MLTVLLHLSGDIEKRDLILRDLEAQNFPRSALQVVLISTKSSHFEDLPKTKILIQKQQIARSDSTPILEAAEKFGGELFYKISESLIFDSGDDLLKIYEYFLENPQVDVSLGYTVHHKVLTKKDNSLFILSSEVLPLSTKNNIIFRKNCLEKSWSPDKQILPGDVFKELDFFGFRVEKLKWLQLHERKNIFWFQALGFQFVQRVRRGLKFVRAHKFWKKLHFYSQKIQPIKRINKLGMVLLEAYGWARPRLISRGVTFGKAMVFVFNRLVFLTKKGFEFLKQLVAERLSSQSPRIEDEKVYVPHLTSSDKRSKPSASTEPEQLPLFHLKEEKNIEEQN